MPCGLSAGITANRLNEAEVPRLGCGRMDWESVKKRTNAEFAEAERRVR